MALVLDIVSWVLLLSGSFFCVVGSIGLLRLPDFFSRVHAAGVTDTLGAGLIMIGLVFQAGFTLITVKLLLIIGFLLLSSATTAHSLVRAALADGLKPLLARDETQPAENESS